MQRKPMGRRTGLCALLNFLLVLVPLAACTIAPTAGALAEGREWQATCPGGQPVATYVALDASGSFDSTDLRPDAEQVIRDAAARTAICGGGHLRVSAFAGSSAGTKLLFDDTVGLIGSTDQGRFRRVPGLQDHVIDEVRDGYADVGSLTTGSDIAGQLRLADEFRSQLGRGYATSVLISTDGLQTVGLNLGAFGTLEAAQMAADAIEVPQLDGVDVTIAGLGNATSEAASTQTAEALVAFYEQLCANTGAARCVVATDYVSAKGR